MCSVSNTRHRTRYTCCFDRATRCPSGNIFSVATGGLLLQMKFPFVMRESIITVLKIVPGYSLCCYSPHVQLLPMVRGSLSALTHVSKFMGWWAVSSQYHAQVKAIVLVYNFDVHILEYFHCMLLYTFQNIIISNISEANIVLHLLHCI